LDHNRARGQIALKAGVQLSDVKNVIIWGNHSSTRYPDVCHATVQGRPCESAMPDKGWLKTDFIEMIQKRGAAIINARKASSAMSAARAITNHMHDWVCGTDKPGEYVSMAVFTDGTDGYGIDRNLIYSFPCICKGKGEYEVVKGLPVDDFSKQKMKVTEKELIEERDLAFQIVGK